MLVSCYELMLEGKWTEKEDELLKKGIEKYGRQWTNISCDIVKTRSPSACIKRAKIIENKGFQI